MPEFLGNKSFDSGPKPKDFLFKEACRISPEDLEVLLNKTSNHKVIENIKAGQSDLQMMQNHEAELAKRLTSVAPRIKIIDLIKGNPTDFADHVKKERKVFGKAWKEEIRFSSAEEIEFSQTARNVGQGNFTEIIQIAVQNNKGEVIKHSTLSGGLEVDKESLDILFEKLDALSFQPESVCIVHNHPDTYEKTLVPADYPLKDGFITRGALSARDIQFADDVFSERYGSKIPVLMVAINELGLTHSYEAGTSENRDWANNRQL